MARGARGRGRQGRPRADAIRTARRVDVVPEGFNVRTSVHEYGGGAYCIHEGVAFVSNFDDQRLYRVDPGARAGADHARGGGAAAPLRRRARHSRRRPLDRRARATRRERQLEGRRERARRPADGRVGRAARDRRRSRLLLGTARLAGRIAALLPRLESPVDAVGRLRAPRRGPRGRRLGRERRARRGRGRRRVDLAAGVEPVGRPRLRERSERLVEPRAHPRRRARRRSTKPRPSSGIPRGRSG